MMSSGSRNATCSVLVMQYWTTVTSEVILEMTSPLRWSLKNPTLRFITLSNRSLRMRCRDRVRMFSIVHELR